MDQFDQPRQPGPARQRVRLYVEQFLALAREGSQGEDDEQAPRIDVLNHVTLDVRDLRVLSAEPPGNAELDAMRARVAALEAVAEAARAALDVDPTSRAGAEAHIRLEAALDAASAAETHEIDVRPMTDDEIRAEQLTQPAGDPWLARCTCGAEMLPLYPGEANAWEQGHLGTRPWVQA